MNNRLFLITILINLSVQVFGQDVIKVTILISQRFQLLLILLKVGSGLIMRRLSMYLRHIHYECLTINICHIRNTVFLTMKYIMEMDKL